MAEYQIVDKLKLDADLDVIGDAIRDKTKDPGQFASAQAMAAAIAGIGGGMPEIPRCRIFASGTERADGRVTITHDPIPEGEKWFYVCWPISIDAGRTSSPCIWVMQCDGRTKTGVTVYLLSTGDLDSTGTNNEGHTDRSGIVLTTNTFASKPYGMFAWAVYIAN